jgi:ubiquinone/menaquinone biosynthesis C-methylase UbiE
MKGCDMTSDGQLRPRDIEEWYRERYKERRAGRDNLLQNPEILFQSLAFDAGIIAAVRSTQVDPSSATILDIGCGSGGSLFNFLRLGFQPSRLYGIDILKGRLSVARARLPQIGFVRSNATNLGFSDNSFDIVLAASVFVTITHDGPAAKIAGEMLRVARLQGHLLLVDWRYSLPWDSRHRCLSRERIEKLFHVGSQSEVCRIFSGALIPPVGRFLSKHAPFAYFAVSFLFPLLVGQKVTVLKKMQQTGAT